MSPGNRTRRIKHPLALQGSPGVVLNVRQQLASERPLKSLKLLWLPTGSMAKKSRRSRRFARVYALNSLKTKWVCLLLRLDAAG